MGGLKFGVDSNGNYGYIKAGADSVTPFSSGKALLQVTYYSSSSIFDGFITDVSTGYSTSKIKVNSFFIFLPSQCGISSAMFNIQNVNGRTEKWTIDKNGNTAKERLAFSTGNNILEIDDSKTTIFVNLQSEQLNTSYMELMISFV